MNMPTLCEFGELVEFDDMKPIRNQLYCEDCYQEWELFCEELEMEESE